MADITPSARTEQSRRLTSNLNVYRMPNWGEVVSNGQFLAIAIVLAIAAWAFYAVFVSLYGVYKNDADWHHGFIMPLFTLLLVFQRRDLLEGKPLLPNGVSWLGVAMIIGAFGFYVVGVMLNVGMMRWWSVWPLITGVILASVHWRTFLVLLPAVLVLLFALPWSDRVYTSATRELQTIASVLASAIVGGVYPGVDTFLEGVTINVFYQGQFFGELNVAETCSGMRSLVGLLSLGFMYAFVQPRPWWHRALLIGLALPIAVFSNLLRILAMGVAYIYVGPQYITGSYHNWYAYAMYPVALGLLLGIGWLLNNLVVYEPDDDADASPPRKAEATAASYTDGRPVGQRERASLDGQNPINKDVRADLVTVLKRPTVIAAIVLLVVFGIAWNSVTNAMGVFLIKENIPLKKSLDTFPVDVLEPHFVMPEPNRVLDSYDNARDRAALLGLLRAINAGDDRTYGGTLMPLIERIEAHWAGGATDLPEGAEKEVEELLGLFGPRRKLAPEMESSLGTEDYITWNFVAADSDLRTRINFFVTYYSGIEDSTIPHVPDECYTGAGSEQAAAADLELMVPGVGLKDDKLPVRLLEFRNSRLGAGQRQFVAYVLNVSNQFVADRTLGRMELTLKGGKYTFLSKVELSTVAGINDRDAVVAQYEKFLQLALPVLHNDYWRDTATYDPETVASETDGG